MLNLQHSDLEMYVEGGWKKRFSAALKAKLIRT